MRVKLDENLGERGRQLFLDADHEVATVRDQGLAGATDVTVVEACKAEQRCLVTLDLDFANPLVFPPEQYSGIAVIRLRQALAPQDLYACVQTLLAGLERGSIVGKLWVVERARIREYLPKEDEDGPAE